jgi:hypothetical protein
LACLTEKILSRRSEDVVLAGLAYLAELLHREYVVVR